MRDISIYRACLCSTYGVLTAWDRYRQVFPRSVHRTGVRRHRARRPSVVAAIELAATATQVQVSREEIRTRRHHAGHRDPCKHKALPSLVGRRRGKSCATEEKEQHRYRLGEECLFCRYPRILARTNREGRHGSGNRLCRVSTVPDIIRHIARRQ